MHLFMSFILRAIFVFIRDKVQAENEKLRKAGYDELNPLDEGLDGTIPDMTVGVGYRPVDFCLHSLL